ncbi:MAG: cytochrome oxidase small assembly protein [Burkholderiaceae bacterium]|nr:cytochrome oxidase small assembly protein [Burkholderiaceae bacterium]
MNRRSNLRTALVLASIALAFFVGVIVNHWLIRR